MARLGVVEFPASMRAITAASIWFTDGDVGAADDPPPFATANILVPASPPVEAATAQQKHNDDDDEKSFHIRIPPLRKVLLVHAADQGAASIAGEIAYFFKASRTVSLTSPMAFACCYCNAHQVTKFRTF